MPKLANIKEELPIRLILYLKRMEICFINPVFAFNMDLVYLSCNELVSDFSHRRKVRYVFLEHDEDHAFV